jgi:FkbM family methyltransferase
VPSTFARLVQNVRLNGVDGRVTALNVGCGAEKGQLDFTSDLDSVNHVATSGDGPGERVSVPVDTLDSLLGGRRPAVIKIDVEGYETLVLAGGRTVFSDASLSAVIMELNGSGARYGLDEQSLHADMLSLGFETAAYTPETRALRDTRGAIATSGNTLYVRGAQALAKRLRSAPAFSVLDRLI